MASHSYALLVVDPDLTAVSDPLQWRRIDTVARFNEVGTGTARLVATQQLIDVLDPGNSMMLIRDGIVHSAGPIEDVDIQWGVEGEEADPGVVDVTWADDLAYIAGRLVYPDPANPATAQTAARRSFTNSNAETVMRTLVDENAGGNALVDRQVPHLGLGDVTGVGANVTWSARFQPLMDALRDVATIGGGLGFRIRRTGAALLFEVYQPRDLTTTVRFSPAWGNLRRYGLRRAAPRSTTAVVGGQDAGVDRVIRERTNFDAEAAWWRVEVFVDRRDQDDPDELDAAGDERIAADSEIVQLSTVTIDTDQIRFGRDYQLGDLVTVALRYGAEVTDVVRAVHLQATAERGEVLTAMVGSQSASSDPEWIQQSRRLARQLALSAAAGEIATGS